jgi:hypothetical protein
MFPGQNCQDLLLVALTSPSFPSFQEEVEEEEASEPLLLACPEETLAFLEEEEEESPTAHSSRSVCFYKGEVFAWSAQITNHGYLVCFAEHYLKYGHDINIYIIPTKAGFFKRVE